MKETPTKVLLVDDDEDDYLLVRKLLSRSSHSQADLRWVSEYEKGLNEIERGGYDVCLLDYQLGNRNGIELLEYAISRGIRTPIVFLTGSGNYELDLKAMRAGAADFLTKDQLNISLLERSMRYALDRARRREELLKAKRVIQSLSECNAAVIRIQDEFELLREICRIVVEVGGYRMAWVGYIEHGTGRSVTPVARYGYEEGYLEAAVITWRKTEFDTNPTGASICSGAPRIFRFVEEQTNSAPWAQEAVKRGYASGIGLPLSFENRILGALTIYSSETHIIDAEEVELLVQLSGNLSHGIEALRRRQAQLQSKKLLKKANTELERRVQERTADLVKLNSQLLDEAEERKRAEQGLRESEGHYRSLFENMLNGFAYCRMLFEQDRPVDFIYLKVNEAFSVLTGLEDVTGKKVSEVLPGIRESDPELFERYARVALTGMPDRFEIYIESIKMWFAISVYSPRREYFVAVFDVINERKYAEEALRKSEERLRLAQDAAKAGSWEWDLRTDKNYWSDELWKLYGLEPNSCEPSHETWLQTVHPADRREVERIVREAARNGTELEAEWRVSGLDGAERWLLSRGRPVRDSTGRVVRYTGIVMDNTERKQAMNALHDSLEEKVSLLKEVHHRVKNNLQIVASLLNLQANRARSRQVVDLLRDTRNRVHSMALLHEVLYRSENLARINFAAYVQELCRQLMRSFGPEAGRIELENRIPKIGLPLEHSVPCGLIITELVSNALKHAFPGGRTGRISVELDHADGRQIRLRVSDDGVGLPEGMEIGDTTTLGLKLVSNLANQLDGQLTLEKRSGGGTAFHVAFRISEDAFLEDER